MKFERRVGFYSLEERQYCQNAMRAGIGLLDLSRQTGVSPTTLRTWREEYRTKERIEELGMAETEELIQQVESLKKKNLEQQLVIEKLKAEVKKIQLATELLRKAQPKARRS